VVIFYWVVDYETGIVPILNKMGGVGALCLVSAYGNYYAWPGSIYCCKVILITQFPGNPPGVYSLSIENPEIMNAVKPC
jgi:hypothetical protein